MKSRLGSFALLLPVMDLTVWVVAIFVPAFLFFFHLKQMARGAETVHLASGNVQMTIPSNRFLSIAFDRAGWRAERLITVLNAPAKLVEIVVSLLVSRTANWYPASFLPSTWRSLIYPIFALPAWFYVGLGFDTLLGRSRISSGNMILSFFLALVSAALCCGFRFGIPAAERQGQDHLNWFIEGFALWAVLFAIPFVASVRDKSKKLPS